MRKILIAVLTFVLAAHVFAEGAKLEYRYKEFVALNWSDSKEFVSEKFRSIHEKDFIERIYKDPENGDHYRVLFNIGPIAKYKYFAKGWDGINKDYIYYVTIENIGRF